MSVYLTIFVTSHTQMGQRRAAGWWRKPLTHVSFSEVTPSHSREEVTAVNSLFIHTWVNTHGALRCTVDLAIYNPKVMDTTRGISFHSQTASSPQEVWAGSPHVPLSCCWDLTVVHNMKKHSFDDQTVQPAENCVLSHWNTWIIELMLHSSQVVCVMICLIAPLLHWLIDLSCKCVQVWSC